VSDSLEVVPEEREVDAGALENPETVEATEEVEAAEQPVEESTTSENADQSEKPQRRSRAQERIDALTREKYERDRQIAQMQEQMAALQQQMPQPQQPDDDIPRLADFGYDEDQYHAALKQWNQSKIDSFQQQQYQAYEQQQRQAAELQQQALLREKVEKATERYPDFKEKVFDPSLPPLREMNPTAFEAILQSDSGTDVAYYLANNPQELYRFASMTPMQTVREITMMEMKLKAAPPKQVRTPSKPPSTVSQGASEAVTDPNKMDIDTWMKWRTSQLQR
jgi:hypothetical protein